MKTKILDCTIRDGGYLNNWDFDEILVKDLYRSVSKSGTDYIEIGFRSSDKYFNSSEVGIWRFTPENIVEEIIKNNAGSKISLMVDFGKVDLSDIPDAALSALTSISFHPPLRAAQASSMLPVSDTPADN